MDLVVGATGLVGKRIALRLREKGRTVRALVRGGATRAEAGDLRQAGIEIVDADVTRPETLASACAGVENLACTVTSMPQAKDDGIRRVDLQGVLSLIEAAERAGVRKFVYTSYSGNIRVDSPLELAKRSCEKRLRDSPMDTVILRPSYFMEMWLSPMLGFDPKQGSVRICGSGEKKISYVSTADVAEFAVAAVTRASKGCLTLDFGGPEPLSQLDVVRIFEERLGRKLKTDFVPLDALQSQHASASDPLQKTFAALMLGYAAGDEIPASRELAAQYGIRLRSVGDYAATFG